MIKRHSTQIVSKEIQNKLDLFYSDLQEVGVSYVGHGVVCDQGNHTGYFSNKKWGDFYIQNKFFFSEPILKTYEENNNELIPWENINEEQPIASQRREQTKINSGVTIYVRDHEYNTFFNMGFHEGINPFEFVFFKKDVLLSYFDIFNNYHLGWRKGARG